MNLISQLESLLFVATKPVSLKTLAKFTSASEKDVRQALAELQQLRKDSGIVVLEADDSYQMATNGANSEITKSFLNSDLRESLTEATVEVLAIVAYRQPITKAEIEAIRGVNSQYSLRALLMRGLIEKAPNPNDARGSLYQVTTEFLQHLGLQSTRDLADFHSLTSQIKLPEDSGIPSAEPSASQTAG